MAAIDVYVPVYMIGADGRLAYQFAKLTAVVTNARVPEGQLCISSRVMTATPPQRLQPKEPGP